MKIAIGCDHGGFELKEFLKLELTKKGFIVTDFGSNGTDPFDYPDVAQVVAKSITDKINERGILICGTGIGISIAANKVQGIRAACCTDYFMAKYTKIHNDSHIICLGARIIGNYKALEMVDVFLNEKFEGGRHQMRLDKIALIERNQH